MITKNETKIAIIISRFNYSINTNLLNGALDTLQRIGKITLKNISIIYVPGAYEIPTISNIIANKKQHHAIITLGTIIKGKTSHYSYISNTIISELLKISIKTNIPISLGIITANNIEQAVERSGLKLGNKGIESALAALEMIDVIKNIKKQHYSK